jgi:hypothetical protein
MAKTKRLDDFTEATNLTGAFISGTDAAGNPRKYQLANIVRNKVGDYKTTDTAPTTPLLNQEYDLIGTGVGQSPSGTYTNLLGVGAAPIVIPAPATNYVIMEAKATWNGTYWEPSYQSVFLPNGVTDGSVTTAKLADTSVTAAKIADGVVTPYKTNMFQPGKNLFNSATATSGFFVNGSTGILSANASYVTSDFIPVSALTAYARTNQYQLAYYNASKVYISGLSTVLPVPLIPSQRRH